MSPWQELHATLSNFPLPFFLLWIHSDIWVDLFMYLLFSFLNYPPAHVALAFKRWQSVNLSVEGTTYVNETNSRYLSHHMWTSRGTLALSSPPNQCYPTNNYLPKTNADALATFLTPMLGLRPEKLVVSKSTDCIFVLVIEDSASITRKIVPVSKMPLEHWFTM